MWRALLVFVGILLAVGLWALVAGGPPVEHTSAAAPGAPGVTEFGFTLAAGAVALAATLLLARPRFRSRR